MVVNGEEGEYAEYEVENEFNVTDTLYFTAQTKRKVSFDRSFAVCCGQSSAYDDNTEIEYESETSSLSYSFARHLTQALQSHKLYLISPELPVGSSILITVYWAHPTNPVEGCADANPKTVLPNDT